MSERQIQKYTKQILDNIFGNKIEWDKVLEWLQTEKAFNEIKKYVLKNWNHPLKSDCTILNNGICEKDILFSELIFDYIFTKTWKELKKVNKE